MTLEQWLKETKEKAKTDGAFIPPNEPQYPIEKQVQSAYRKEEKKLKRRTVKTITEYYDPKRIFELITNKYHFYHKPNYKYLQSRDRVMMAMAYCSGGRITAICGGPKLATLNLCVRCGNKVEKMEVEDELVWVCLTCQLNLGRKKRKDRIISKHVVVGEYTGITRRMLAINSDFIEVRTMEVVKRTRKLVEKYGKGVAQRDDFILPLKVGLMETAYWDQLVPFSHLVLDHIKTYDPQSKLIGYTRGRAWQLVLEITGKFPNWFRAQCEHFYGNYIYKDSVLLSKFVKVVRPAQVGHYIGSAYEAQFKDKSKGMDFNWIEPAVREIEGGKYH